MQNGLQKDRIYSLIVGTKEEAVEITNLHIKFNVTKTSSNKDRKNSATVEIYNLSETTRKKLEQPYVQVMLKVGYVQTGLSLLFVGQVVNMSTSRLKPFLSKKQGADIVTKLEVDEFYEALNTRILGRTMPEGSTVGNAIQQIVSVMPEVESTIITGDNVNKTFPDGYPLNGTPRQNLDRISQDYDVEWQIDNSVLYVSDHNKSFTKDMDRVPLIGQTSGLIESPEFINEEAKRYRREVKDKPKKYKNPKPNSIRVKILLNAAIVAGSTIKLQYEDLTGYYIVGEVQHTGGYRDNDWYSTLLLTERID